MFIIALATLSIAGQVHAAAKDTRPKDVVDKANRDAKAAAASAGASMGHADVPRRLDTALTRMRVDPTQKNTIVTKTGEMLKSSDASIVALAEARVAGIENLGRLEFPRDLTDSAIEALDPAKKAEHDYETLVMDVVSEATEWDAKTRTTVTELLKETNQLISTGKSAGEALLEAGKKRGLKVDEIRKLCKKA